MKWYAYVLCLVMIVIGTICTIELVDVFNITSADYGKAITIETKNDYEEVSKFDLGAIPLSSADYVNYSYTNTYGAEKFDGNKNEYLLLLNGKPADNFTQSSGKVSGMFVLKFYDTDGSVLCTSKLSVLIEYLAGGTRVSLNLVNENDSISYFNTYSNINGAVLKVVRREI